MFKILTREEAKRMLSSYPVLKKIKKKDSRTTHWILDYLSHGLIYIRKHWDTNEYVWDSTEESAAEAR